MASPLPKGIIDEYRSLREEILQRQQGRLVTLGFASAAVGTIIGFLVNGSGDGPSTMQAVALLYAALFITLLALRLEIRNVQKVHLIASYIRSWIEPEVAGLNWESRLEASRSGRQPHWKHNLVRRPMATYYALVAAGVCFLAVAQLHTIQWWLAGMGLIGLWIWVQAFDLLTSRSAAWRANWNVAVSYEEPGPDQAHPTGRLRLEAVGRRPVCIHAVAAVSPREDRAPDGDRRSPRRFLPGGRQVSCEPPPGRSFPLELRRDEEPLFVDWPGVAMSKEAGTAVVEVTYDLGDGALERPYRVQVAFRRHEGPIQPRTTEEEIDLRQEEGQVEVSTPPRASAEAIPSPPP